MPPRDGRKPVKAPPDISRPSGAEDFWCPEVKPLRGGLKEHPLPEMRPPANHDGTECLKWDETLWSHADHFRVRLQLPVADVSSWDCRFAFTDYLCMAADFSCAQLALHVARSPAVCSTCLMAQSNWQK